MTSVAIRKMLKNKQAMLGVAIILFLVLVALFAQVIAPYDPYKTDYSAYKEPPSAQHLLGTDELGRDVLSRLIYGTRISLTIGVAVAVIAMGIGVPLGAIAGYYGGTVDLIIMRIVDILMAFPFIVLAIAMVAIAGPSLGNMMLVLGGVSWIWYTRLVRGMVLAQREEDYVLAARALGASSLTIIFRHLLPNVLAVVIVQASFSVAEAILAAASLSYLGLGAQPPTAEWGAMLSNAKEYMRILPVLSIAPGVAIMITVLAINFIGDALRDALDPTLRQ
ncbi:ABC transporter permease [Phototrophicus methaneseepsis]|uniref:ABC transporter permease n=2 Tax=Phototrophicus methaneseepsis TaxID=2710758 RepID=A0A7S8EE52_9CHLR|nr:ABC transporter permease [Phototrophicus methaneseepsis]